MNLRKIIFCMLIPFSLILLAACNSDGTTNAKEGEETSGFPEKPIKIVVGFEPGGIIDTGARVLAKELGKKFDQKVDVVVEGKPGGAGIVAMTEVVNSKPDGYTIGFTPTGPVTIQPHFGQTAYTYDDPTLISMLSTDSFMLAVHKDAPWDDFDSFYQDVKENPGKYTYSHPGSGTIGELAMMTLAQETGIDVKSVPFQGSTPARTALLGKNVDAGAIVGTDIIPYAESGDIKVLMVFSDERHEKLPDVPTAKEKGYSIEIQPGFLLYGPKDLPKEIRDVLDKAVAKTMEEESVLEDFEKIGLPPNYQNADDTVQVIEQEYNANKKVIDGTGK